VAFEAAEQGLVVELLDVLEVCLKVHGPTFYTLTFRASPSPMGRLSAAGTLANSLPIFEPRRRVSGCAQSPFRTRPKTFARRLAPRPVKRDRTPLEQSGASGASSHRSPGQHGSPPPRRPTRLSIAQGEQRWAACRPTHSLRRALRLPDRTQARHARALQLQPNPNTMPSRALEVLDQAMPHPLRALRVPGSNPGTARLSTLTATQSHEQGFSSTRSAPISQRLGPRGHSECSGQTQLSVLHRGASAEVRSRSQAVSDDSDELAGSKGLVHDCVEAGQGADLGDSFRVGGDENDRKV